MTTNPAPPTRDEVLFAFHQAYDRPTADQILEWIRRYPQFAEDIRAHAAISHDLAARPDAPPEPVDQTMLDRGFSRVLNALFDAEQTVDSGVRATSPGSPPTFHAIMAARRTDVRRLARELDIERGVLADLFSGRMLAPVGDRLVAALTSALAVTREGFDHAVEAALDRPRAGLAKAEQAPSVTARSFANIIRDSGMSPERKRYWLGED